MSGVLHLTAGLCTGLTAGAYAAFSVMVLPGLRSGPPAEMLTTMQRVNRAAVRPAFLSVFFGAAGASAATLLVAGPADGTSEGWTRAAAVTSLLGFAITLCLHVPRNRALADLDAGSTEDLRRAQRIIRQWSWGNHVRSLAAAASLAAWLR